MRIGYTNETQYACLCLWNLLDEKLLQLHAILFGPSYSFWLGYT